VATLEQRRQAARIARSVRGIDSLTNEVTVQGNDPTEAATASNARAGPVESDTSRDASALYYTVEAGDTLWNIARDHRASVQRIKDLNDLTSGDLQPGERIRVR
jgi:LysM repeat protein